MNNFFGNFAYFSCGNGCNANLQKLLLNEENQPTDVDWEGFQQVYNEHNLKCSVDSPYTDDINAFYGNPDDCAGFVEENNSNSGYRYCEY